MRLSNLLTPGSRCAYQSLLQGCLNRCALQHLNSCVDRQSFIGVDQTRICSRAWQRKSHSNLETLDLRHSYLPQSGPSHWSFSQKEQRRWVVGTPAKRVDSNAKSISETIVYRGPLSDTVRRVKTLSITTCCLSVLFGPVITFLTSPHLPVIVKGGVAATVMLLSASTTAALHWFVGSYVHKLTWKPGDKEMEVELISWMATTERRTIQVSDIRPPKTNRPFVTFAAKNKFYFVDTEKLSNKDLLRLVTFYGKPK